ncbi:hypothetical protein HMPREF1983_01364 [Gemella bergeri ATCC 700627]|uniref:Uncharacterized protein n=1 Tax=Gemella bergeri ATCC 700627 TaxID=1321820 RepID=U2RS92_9BACL|nr:hypothetical protein HMPREF1983_01364 [Gemella bergeri ATCC 700627]
MNKNRFKEIKNIKTKPKREKISNIKHITFSFKGYVFFVE